MKKIRLLPADRQFFSQEPTECARRMIGGTLVWDGFRAKIVETEAYGATGDPACHTFTRPSARHFVASNPPGTAYVYLNYGVHWMLNVLVKGGSSDGFVLFRGLELERVPPELCAGRLDPRCCAGPGKLTRVLGITGDHHGLDLCCDESRGFLIASGDGGSAETEVLQTPRIGISRGQDLLWRFVLRGSEAVSQKRAAKPALPKKGDCGGS